MPERKPLQEDVTDTTLLVETVREAGKIARKYFRGEYSSWDKGRGNPVTDADIAIDRNLREVLLAARPNYGWLSEETEDDPARLTRDRVFIVDPIDGTVGFIKGRPHFTIVATVVHAGRPVSAAIYNPITEEMYDAAYCNGARLNGDPISVSDKDTLEGCRMLAPRVYFEPERWQRPWPDSMQVETRSSIAYRLALVAAGKFDAVLSLTAKHDWDLAAGDLMVNEAGGCVLTPNGEILTYNNATPLQQGVLSAGPALHAKLRERLQEQLP
ncbi:MAG: 3'(2'),5'-bisphosphate nucleotidase CysQ [Micropepsaceae bacterium]